MRFGLGKTRQAVCKFKKKSGPLCVSFILIMSELDIISRFYALKFMVLLNIFIKLLEQTRDSVV